MVDIVPLTPARAGEWLSLFDGEGFADNQEWAGCYCRFYHFDHDAGDFGAQTARDNRAAACDMIAGRAMRGWLALEGGKAIGWLNAARKDSFCALSGPDVPGMAGDETGMITCFLIAPSARGKGVASALLNAAITDFRKNGIKQVEAKPAIAPQRAASDYHGPLAMYEKAGFQIVGAFSEHQHLVRLSL